MGENDRLRRKGAEEEEPEEQKERSGIRGESQEEEDEEQEEMSYREDRDGIDLAEIKRLNGLKMNSFENETTEEEIEVVQDNDAEETQE
jgi:hypothetical protein